MTRILVVPEQLRSLSSRLQQASQELSAISGRVGGALGGLEWEARQKTGVDGMTGDARWRASALARQAETMARYLTQKAQAFEDADRQSLADINDIICRYPIPTPTPTPAPDLTSAPLTINLALLSDEQLAQLAGILARVPTLVNLAAKILTGAAGQVLFIPPWGLPPDVLKYLEPYTDKGTVQT